MKKNFVILASGFTLIMFAVVIYVAMPKRSSDLIQIDEPIRASAITLPAGKVDKTNLVDAMADSMAIRKVWNDAFVKACDDAILKQSNEKVRKVLELKRDSVAWENHLLPELIKDLRMVAFHLRQID